MVLSGKDGRNFITFSDLVYWFYKEDTHKTVWKRKIKDVNFYNKHF